jgi:hypothetical protein
MLLLSSSSLSVLGLMLATLAPVTVLGGDGPADDSALSLPPTQQADLCLSVEDPLTAVEELMLMGLKKTRRFKTFVRAETRSMT